MTQLAGIVKFIIKYKIGHYNRAVDALGQHPCKPFCDIDSKTDSNGMEIISDSSVCGAVDQCPNSPKIHKDIKQEAQHISCVVQSIVEEEDNEEIVSTLNAVSLFEKLHL